MSDGWLSARTASRKSSTSSKSSRSSRPRLLPLPRFREEGQSAITSFFTSKSQSNSTLDTSELSKSTTNQNILKKCEDPRKDTVHSLPSVDLHNTADPASSSKKCHALNETSPTKKISSSTLILARKKRLSDTEPSLQKHKHSVKSDISPSKIVEEQSMPTRNGWLLTTNQSIPKKCEDPPKETVHSLPDVRNAIDQASSAKKWHASNETSPTKKTPSSTLILASKKRLSDTESSPQKRRRSAKSDMSPTKIVDEQSTPARRTIREPLSPVKAHCARDKPSPLKDLNMCSSSCENTDKCLAKSLCISVVQSDEETLDSITASNEKSSEDKENVNMCCDFEAVEQFTLGDLVSHDTSNSIDFTKYEGRENTVDIMSKFTLDF